MFEVKQMTKYKICEFEFSDLVKEALTTPNGWKKEVYVENGEIEFSSPMTQNSYIGTDANTPIAFADIQSLSFSELDGFREEDDGTITINGEKVSYDEALDAAENVLLDYSLGELYEKLRKL